MSRSVSAFSQSGDSLELPCGFGSTEIGTKHVIPRSGVAGLSTSGDVVGELLLLVTSASWRERRLRPGGRGVPGRRRGCIDTVVSPGTAIWTIPTGGGRTRLGADRQGAGGGRVLGLGGGRSAVQDTRGAEDTWTSTAAAPLPLPETQGSRTESYNTAQLNPIHIHQAC